jgi:hypothetical protein
MSGHLQIAGGAGTYGGDTHSGIHHRDRGPVIARNEYLVAENRILMGTIAGAPALSDAERTRLDEIGHRLRQVMYCL